MDQNNENQFPSEYDEYYYYCRIMYIEQAREEFIKCNGFILGDQEKDSIAESLLVKHSQDDRSLIYKKYRKLYDDYIKYSDILIAKQGIDTEADYARVLKNLMRILNETTKFTYYNFLMKNNKKLNKKYAFIEKKIKLKTIIKYNSRIFYLLNPNDNINIFMDKHFNSIISSCILVLLLLGALYPLSVNDIKNQGGIIDNPSMIFSIVIAFIFGLLGLILLIMKILYRRKIEYMQLKGDIDSKNDKLILHVFKNKIRCSDILKSFNSLIETLKNIKELK